MRKFFPGHKPPEKDIKKYKSVRHSKLDKMFTEHKIRRAFSSFGSFKSPGPDKLQPIVFQNLGPKAIKYITNIMCASYSTGYIPLSWREAKVVFIPKPKKEDYSEVGSFRPISLMQFLLKTMERVIDWYLKEQQEKIGKISLMQHAYCSSKGTDTALSTLVDKIESAIYRDDFALVISVDI